MTYDRKTQCWYEYGKLSDGKTAVIVFDKNYRRDIGSESDYFVSFAISNKKKYLKQWITDEGRGNLDHEITGSGNTEGLVWAFNRLKYFIEEHLYRNDRIIIQGSDNRRFRIYEHFLGTRLGFKKIRDPFWGVCLEYEKI